MRWLFKPHKVLQANIRSKDLQSKPHSLSPGEKWAPSVSLSASPLCRKKQGDKMRAKREDRRGKRGNPGPQFFMCSVFSCALYAQLSLSGILLLASYALSMIHSFLSAGRILITTEKQTFNPSTHHAFSKSKREFWKHEKKSREIDKQSIYKCMNWQRKRRRARDGSVDQERDTQRRTDTDRSDLLDIARFPCGRLQTHRHWYIYLLAINTRVTHSYLGYANTFFIFVLLQNTQVGHL